MRKIKLLFVLSALPLAFTTIYLFQQNSFSATLLVKNIDVVDLFSNNSAVPQKKQLNNINVLSATINNEHLKDFFQPLFINLL